MHDKYLFISGMPKCGTTALAAWLVEQGLADYLIPGMKETQIYARTDFDAVAAKAYGGLMPVQTMLSIPMH